MKGRCKINCTVVNNSGVWVQSCLLGVHQPDSDMLDVEYIPQRRSVPQSCSAIRIGRRVSEHFNEHGALGAIAAPAEG